MSIVEKIVKNRKQIVDVLYEWAETFDVEKDEDGEKTTKSYDIVWELAQRLELNKCTENDYENIVFHIYQINYDEIRIRL